MYTVPLLAHSLSPLLAASFKCYEMIVRDLNISSLCSVLYNFLLCTEGIDFGDCGRKLVTM